MHSQIRDSLIEVARESTVTYYQAAEKPFRPSP